ncbi:MAG TPA: enolase C-terminal domain-like protein [Bryobacteraceae bacterium]|nr:enolase C-terminal domain-like protein [Bryobacteraceae bacterium]
MALSSRRKALQVLAAAPFAAYAGRMPAIRDIRVIATAPAGLRLSIVRIQTDVDGLHGYGCGTFTQRADLVNLAVERYLHPLLVGKPVGPVEDTWHLAYNSSYWRNDAVMNNALSGVDQALWDIQGKLAGQPVYQLLGGKVREAAECYAHAGGEEISQVVESAKDLQRRGFRHIRVQVGVPNQAAYSSGGGRSYGGGRAPAAMGRQNTGALHDGPMFEPAAYIRRTLRMLEKVREELGDSVELLHDVHERILPIQALQFAKDVERFRLFFLEDAVSPEDIGWYRHIRRQSTTPLAMGELFNNPHEWEGLVRERLIDYLRIHMSQAGGLTPCRKIAAFTEGFGVKTAWHGPGDVSPIGHAANLALDLACPNFGIRELVQFNEQVQEVFPGAPVSREGYLWANEKPGWGITLDEKAAAKYPFGHMETGERQRFHGGWGVVRRRDGAVIKQ